MNTNHESNSLLTEDKIKDKGVPNDIEHVQTIKEKGDNIPKNSKFGRTIWDFLSERIDRKARNQINGYRFGFFIILIFGLSYGSYYLMQDEISDISIGVTAIKNETSSIWQDVTDIKQRLGEAPSSAGWFGKHSGDLVSCKARGVEALQRAGATKINSEQSTTAFGTFHPNIYGFSCAGVVHCLEGGYVYIYAASQDIDLASKYRDLIQENFEKVTKQYRSFIDLFEVEETVPNLQGSD